MFGERKKPLVTLWQSSRNWLRKNTKVVDTIRLVNVFTGAFVKSLVLIAPKTGMITSQSQWRSQKDASYSVQTDHKIECNRPDIVIVEKNLEKAKAIPCVKLNSLSQISKCICFLWMYLATVITERNNRAVLSVLILHKNLIYHPR